MAHAYVVVNRHGKPYRTEEGEVWCDYLEQAAKFMADELNCCTARADQVVVTKGRPWNVDRWTLARPKEKK